MITQRVKLSGFLSYKDEQEIPFTGSPLWMLAGVNGSGKSSVFDAVTYALFGHHRGGSQNAAELINKESTALAVEFDFTLDGHLFRIRRTLKRGARGNTTGTQQLFRHAGSSPGNEDGWEAVPDTNKKVDFDAWVHARVGLTYETFTSSVLLLQGKAEKLLDSKPSGRAEVLWVSMSSGSTSTTGPGRPFRAVAKARATYSGMRSGESMRSTRFAMPFVLGPKKLA